MSLPGFSVRRPVLTTMATVIVGVLGAAALGRLEIDLLPDIELPTVSVRTEYPGASPQVMESRVTQILEEILATVPGVVELSSQTAQGSSQVRVTFGWGADVDTAALDIQSILQDELDELPEETSRPQIRKFDISSFPVVILGVASALDPIELTDLIEREIRQRFSRIPQVAQVDVWGGYPREVRVEVNLDRLNALNLSLSEVVEALRDANLDLPAGEIEVGRNRVVLRAPAEFDNLQDIRRTVVALRDGAPVTVGQFARVLDTYEHLTRRVRVNGDLGIRLAIRKQARANTVEVSRRVLATLREINRDFPQIRAFPIDNQGNFIERSIQNVARSVLYGGGLAILVLLLFLLSVRSALVVAAAIPISILATFAAVFGFGLTLNLTTLGGLALGVGMMVDSSIVVLENVFRRRNECSERVEVAAVQGATEVAGALVASTLTTLVVFLPLAFVRGLSGLLFKELAYVVAFSLIASLLVSLTFLPMVAARVIPATSKVPRAFDGARRALERLDALYAGGLARCLARPTTTVAVATALLLGSLSLYPWIGSEFLPPTDEGQVQVIGRMDIGTRLDLVDVKARELMARVTPLVPEAVASVVSVGGGVRRPQDAASARVQISLTPAAARDRSNVEIAAALRRGLEQQIPGMRVRVRAPQGSFVLQRLLRTEEGLSIEVRGYDLERLEEVAKAVASAAETVPGVTDAEVSRKEGVPQYSLHIDRDKAADLGLRPRDVAAALQTAVAGTEAGEFRTEGEAYRILVQLEEAHELKLERILTLGLPTPTGEAATLGALVRVEETTGPLVIERKDQQRMISVAVNVAGRDLGSVAEDLEARLRAVPRPQGYDLRLAGAFEEQKKSARELFFALALAVALVYMVLAAQYESLRDPLVVMVSVPLSAIGVLTLLYVTDTTLNVQSYLGCIMLGGIVVNNAILLVDQAGSLLAEGQPALRAVAEAGRRRLRPILMTTSTTILGLLPLALGLGEGADAQAPLARAVIGGLLGSTPIVLVLIPVVFMLVHRPRAP